MEKRNRYRNPVRLGSVFRIVFFCVLLGLAGAAFVYIRNQLVQQGREISRLEKEIAELDHEKQLWDLRIAGAMDRMEMTRRLEWMGSDLIRIDPSRILKIQTAPGRDAEPPSRHRPH